MNIMIHRSKLWTGIALGILQACATHSAFGQATSTILRPVLPPDYNRGRNVSVTERPRPDYDALGVRLGSFILLPKIVAGAGVSDNVYMTANGKVSDEFVSVAPSATLRSDWSRHQVMLQAGGDFRRYFSETLVNADQWNVSALGRADIINSLSVTLEGQAAHAQEEPFSGESDSNIAVLSRYDRWLLGARAQYRMGRVRVTGGYNYSGIKFDPVSLTNGISLSQADRDREIHAVNGQVEYAMSPSFILYGQATYTKTNYDRPLLSGVANRDSDEIRALVGVNLDLSGFLRGTIGVGYVKRNYNSPIYADVKGLAADVKLEYFYSELTTFTLTGSRSIDDASVGGLGAFRSTRIGLRADQEVLRNILLNVGVDYTHLDYVASTRKNNIYRLHGGVDLLISRRAKAGVDMSYSSRARRGTANNNDIEEARGQLTFTYQL